MTSARSAALHDAVAAGAAPVSGVVPVVSGMPLLFLRWEGLVLLTGSLAVFFGGLDEPW